MANEPNPAPVGDLEQAHGLLLDWLHAVVSDRPDLSHAHGLRWDPEGQQWCCDVTSREFGRDDDDVYRNGIAFSANPAGAAALAIEQWGARRYVTLDENHRLENERFERLCGGQDVC